MAEDGDDFDEHYLGIGGSPSGKNASGRLSDDPDDDGVPNFLGPSARASRVDVVTTDASRFQDFIRRLEGGTGDPAVAGAASWWQCRTLPPSSSDARCASYAGLTPHSLRDAPTNRASLQSTIHAASMRAAINRPVLVCPLDPRVRFLDAQRVAACLCGRMGRIF